MKSSSRSHGALTLLLMSIVGMALAAPAQAFDQPQQLRSKNGVLKAKMVAELGEAVVAGKRVSGAITFNGQFPGPTLNVHPGDTIELDVVNKLQQDTNIHFHGMHVSPAGIADNVLRRFRPGGTYKVRVKIPHDHNNGLYWYHPHLAGQVNNQVFRGLAGMISITGGSPEVKSLRPYRKRQIALNLTQFNEAGTSFINPNNENDLTSTTTVNGKLGQTIKMRPGQTELWQIANISNEGFYKLSLDGHKLWVVGQDGNPTRVAQRTGSILLVPGARYEVLVRAGSSGKFTLRQHRYFEGFNTFPAQDLLTLDVAGESASSPNIPHHIKAFKDLSKAKVDVKRRWVLSFSPNSAPTFKAYINGKTFDPDRVDTRARLNDVEEWTFVNGTSEDHPIHLHTNDFQVVKFNGKARRPAAPIDDTVLPRNGSITIRFKPLTYTGLAVFHCHILFHEDSGMMATIRFVKDTAQSSVVAAAGMPGIHHQAELLVDELDPGTSAKSALSQKQLEDFWLFCRLNGLQSP